MDMMITGIEDHPKGKGRVRIFMNNEFAFVLYKGELSQYGIECGVTVTDTLYDRIMQETVFPRARKRAMNLLMNIDRTEADVRRRLSEDYPPEAVDNAVAYVMSFGYIDDKRYAEEFIRCKTERAGRKQIRSKLMEKGISGDVIDAAFESYDEEFGDGGNADRQLIRKLIIKRQPTGVADLSYSDRQKLFAYLYGKGFSVSDIEAVYAEMNDPEACKAFGEANGVDFTYYRPEEDSTVGRVAMIEKAAEPGAATVRIVFQGNIKQ